MSTVERCPWPGDDPLMTEYHDKEWGVPVHDDRKLFEFLVLDAAQAGLSWKTILYKRENYRKAFHGFDPGEIARYDESDLNRLLANPGLVRNRLKVASAVQNAKGVLDIQEGFGSFDSYIWRFVDGRTMHNHFQSVAEIPPRSAESDAMSKDLKARGFRFVGSVICYAFMQAAGMVNDHVVSCFRYPELKEH